MQKDSIVVGIILLIVLWALIEQKLIVTSKHSIISAKLPEQINNTSFVVLADLHNRTFGKKNVRLIQRINALAPEFIIVAGDMVNKKEPSHPSNGYSLLEQLSKKYKIYYAYGNHEQRIELNDKEALTKDKVTANSAYSTWVEYKELLKKSNVTFLNNESSIYIKNNTRLRITGISIEPKYFERNKMPAMDPEYLTSLVGNCSKEEYQILVAHNPIYFKSYIHWGADLTVSGHLHGGMVRLPGIGGMISPQAKLFPKYHAGKYEEKGQQLVVSRGLGSHSIMPRLFNIPELIYINLKKEL